MPVDVRRLPRIRVALIAAGLVAIVAVLSFAVVAFSGRSETAAKPAATLPPVTATATATASPTSTPEASPTPIAHPGLLDGIPMTDAEWDARKDLAPLAVMVDNTTGAVPHAGIGEADLVYEAFVEGGITRLMAVFWRQDAEKILPVRSARTPFVVWASELLAQYAHAGGAQTDNDANAVGQVAEWGVPDLNAFSPISSNYYFRDHERSGPYDLATSTTYLREAASQLGFTRTAVPDPWKFREPAAALPKGQPAGGIEVFFNRSLYSWQYIQWKWDSAANRYLRSQFGGPHVDVLTGRQLAFATVIVMEMQASVVDESGHVIYEQLGSGPATVFTGGMAYPGQWKKEKRESRTRFYGGDGNEIIFERGPVFIEAIAQQSSFAFKTSASDLPPMPEFTPPPPGPPPVEPDHDTPTPAATATATQPAPPTPTARTTPSPTPAGTPTRTLTPTSTPTITPVP